MKRSEAPVAPGAKGAPWDGARRILIVRLGALGDVVRTRIAFAGLRERFPDARMDWLVEDRAAAGLVGLPGLDQTVVLVRGAVRPLRPRSLWRELRRVVATLRAGDYDLAVDFHSILKSALLVRAARIPVRVAYGGRAGREGAAWLATHRVDLADGHVSRFERNGALLSYLGGGAPARPPRLDLPASAREAAAAELQPFVVLHPGTSAGTLYKRWEAERFGEVARGLAEDPGIPSVVTFGPVPGERETAEAVVEASGGAARLAAPFPDLAGLLALLERSALFLGPDSGPLHLAAAAGCPTVAVFGPTDRVENAPFPGLPSRVVSRDVGCNPCREGCPARTCMAAVPAQAVLEAARSLLLEAA